MASKDISQTDKAESSKTVIDPTTPEISFTADELKTLPFPPLTTSHILACSVHSWYPLFRPHTPKTRLIPLPETFVSYLRQDGIILPPSRPSSPSPPTTNKRHKSPSSRSSSRSSFSSHSSEDDDPSRLWPETHLQIRTVIAELGGRVVPKLNWSAPKDATWMVAGNSLECRTPNDIYLLLKSSDFVTHDLEQWDVGCIDRRPLSPPHQTPDETVEGGEYVLVPPVSVSKVDYHLVLRKAFNLNPSLEFRIFVREGVIIGISQRDLNFYDFLFPLRNDLKKLIMRFWKSEVCGKFTETNYAMDVYVPAPYERCWIVDFDPWDRRTDPLLFSWGELLTMQVDETEEMRIYVGDDRNKKTDEESGESEDENYVDESDDEDEENVEEIERDSFPELRLVNKTDPEAYRFNSTRYSAHKLPREVVDAGSCGQGGIREFADRWKEIIAEQEKDRQTKHKNSKTTSTNNDNNNDDSDADDDNNNE